VSILLLWHQNVITNPDNRSIQIAERDSVKLCAITHCYSNGNNSTALALKYKQVVLVQDITQPLLLNKFCVH
jgi:NADH:ubiquinone oxidoreductase subunit E